jgi:membrane protease YdiL (CAAX protease family)
VENGGQIPGSTDPAARRIPLHRAFGEIFSVYVPSFGLGILSAVILLHNPNQATDQITGPVSALAEILQYIMQASVTVFGVGYFCQRRGVTMSQLFGRPADPDAGQVAPYTPLYPQPPSLVTPPWGAAAGQPPPPPPPQPMPDGGYWPGYAHYMPPRPPARRGKGWQFSRAYFVSMAGVLGFLISVIVYTAVTHDQTGAPSQGDSPYLVLVGLFVALAAGFGEEMLVTGLTVNALEAAGVTGKRVWLIYLVAVCLRIPFHLYYGWAALGVVIFTVVNVWVYRRWRLLWPIVLAHATYDFVESIGATAPTLAGLLLLALGLATLVMVIVVVCIESSDRSARRRFSQYQAAALAAQSAQNAFAAQQVGSPEMPPLDPPASTQYT